MQKQPPVAAIHQGHPETYQASGAIAQVMGDPAVFRDRTGAKQGGGNLTVRRAIEAAIQRAQREDEPFSPGLGQRRWVRPRLSSIERTPEAQGSGYSDFKEPVERQKNRRRLSFAAHQMNTQRGAKPLDDIVVTFSSMDRVERERLRFLLRGRKPWRKSAQSNDAGQSLCRPKCNLGVILRREEVTPSAGRTQSPRRAQGPRRDPFVAAFPDLLRNRDCGSGTEKQILGHRMSVASCMPPVTASTRGS
jgi:hypothetical protein